MTNTVKTIAELTTQQIDALNAYLVKMGREIFTPAQVNFLANRDELDVLDLVGNVQCVRGFFADRETMIEDKRIGFNLDGESLKNLVKQYADEFEGDDDYDEQDVKELVADFEEKTSNEIIEHVVFLNSSKYWSTDVILLNKNFQPIEIDCINLQF